MLSTLATMCQWNTKAEIEYLPPYTPSQEEKEDPGLFADNVRNMMSEKMGIPISNIRYRDGIKEIMEGEKDE